MTEARTCTVEAKKLEHRRTMIHAGLPCFFGLRLKLPLVKEGNHRGVAEPAVQEDDTTEPPTL